MLITRENFETAKDEYPLITDFRFTGVKVFRYSHNFQSGFFEKDTAVILYAYPPKDNKLIPSTLIYATFHEDGSFKDLHKDTYYSTGMIYPGDDKLGVHKEMFLVEKDEIRTIIARLDTPIDLPEDAEYYESDEFTADIFNSNKELLIRVISNKSGLASEVACMAFDKRSNGSSNN